MLFFSFLRVEILSARQKETERMNIYIFFFFFVVVASILKERKENEGAASPCLMIFSLFYSRRAERILKNPIETSILAMRALE